MVVRKIIGIALLPLMCASLFACNHSDDIHQKSDINRESTDVKLPFDEGYYIGNDYTLQIVYIGNKTEHSYGVSFLDNDTGAEEFFGLVYNVSPKARSFTVPGYIDQSAMLFADKVSEEEQNCVVKVSDLSEEGVSAALCGEYEYGGAEWTPAVAANADIITAGVYAKDKYTLSIEEQSAEMLFRICDDEGNELFSGTCRSRERDTVMIGDENSYFRFAKCRYGDGAYIDVSVVGYNEECDYFGKYALVQ